MALGRGHFLSFLLPSCRLLKGPYHRVRGSLLWEVCIKNESLWGENEGFVLIHRASQETSIKSYLYRIRNNNLGKKTNQFSTRWMITTVKKIIDNFVVFIFTSDLRYQFTLQYEIFWNPRGKHLKSLLFFDRSFCRKSKPSSFLEEIRRAESDAHGDQVYFQKDVLIPYSVGRNGNLVRRVGDKNLNC